MIGEGYDLNNPNNIPGFKQTTNFKPKYAVRHRIRKRREQLQSSFLICHVLVWIMMIRLLTICAIPADKNFCQNKDQLLNQDLFTLNFILEAKTKC